MKSILLSIRPEWVCKILNGEKTIEIRKQFPKDYVGWVYIYCTKTALKKPALTNFNGDILNGKVVARFWCDKVEEITFNGYFCPNDDEYTTKSMNGKELIKASCLDLNHLVWYFDGKHKDTNVGYGIYISKLEVFDEPKELSEFYCNYTLNDYKKGVKTNYIKKPNVLMKKLTKAPQNYCYIEGEE